MFFPPEVTLGNIPPARGISLIAICVFLGQAVLLVHWMETYQPFISKLKLFISNKHRKSVRYLLLGAMLLSAGIFTPTLMSLPVDVYYAKEFKSDVIRCRLHQKKHADHYCVNAQHYPHVRFLGWPNNIGDKHSFG